MEIVVLLIAIVVGIDAFVRFDKGRLELPSRGEETAISTQKIVVDLSKRL
ncbi:MAG: hypothetical protein JWO36_1956 [Myxococcales bacterium]|nr:hypothetical protein [Myxococcales bacterium]